MADVRWFAPNRHGTLPATALRNAGLTIALEGDAPCGAVIASDGVCAREAFGCARRNRAPLGVYLWDLPPWRLGNGRPDPVLVVGARLIRLRRPWGGYPERAGYYSRLRYMARRAQRVWCPSEFTAGELLRRFGVSATHLPFCYDSDMFTGRGEPPLPPVRSPFTILSISRLVPYKNHAAILRAAARLAPGPLVRILGRGPEASGLEALAARLGVALDLRTRWASEEEIVDAYRQADVVVSASRFEGFGLTPVEGLAMGVPVVASDIPPHREFLSGAARFFPPDDDVALAAAITAAVTEPPIPSAARSAALAPLSIEACAARFLPEVTALLSEQA